MNLSLIKGQRIDKESECLVAGKGVVDWPVVPSSSALLSPILQSLSFNTDDRIQTSE
jgi:hypothetical protein